MSPLWLLVVSFPPFLALWSGSHACTHHLSVLFSPSAYSAVLMFNHTLLHSFPSPLSYRPPHWCLPLWTPPQVPDWWKGRSGCSWGAKTPGSPRTPLIMKVFARTWRMMTCLPGEPLPSSPTQTWLNWRLCWLADIAAAPLSRSSTLSPRNPFVEAPRKLSSQTLSRTMWCFVGRKPSRHSNSDHSQEHLTTMPRCPSQSLGHCLLTSSPDSSAPHVPWLIKQQYRTWMKLIRRPVLKRMTC